MTENPRRKISESYWTSATESENLLEREPVSVLAHILSPVQECRTNIQYGIEDLKRDWQHLRDNPESWSALVKQLDSLLDEVYILDLIINYAAGYSRAYHAAANRPDPDT